MSTFCKCCETDSEWVKQHIDPYNSLYDAIIWEQINSDNAHAVAEDFREPSGIIPVCAHELSDEEVAAIEKYINQSIQECAEAKARACNRSCKSKI